MRSIALACFLALAASPALAQGTIQQAGPVVQRHILGVVQSGMLGDSGYASGAGPNNGVGAGIAEQLLIAPKLPSGPNGENWCNYDAQVTGPQAAPGHYICLSPNAGGQGALLSVGTVNGGAQLPLSFLVNGVTYPFPFGSPSTGTPYLGVADIPALQVLPITAAALTNRIRVGTYSLAAGIFSPPVDYYLTSTACAPDAGSCIAAATGGLYWHITPQTIYDLRWWGAYGDVVNNTTVTTITGGVCDVQTAAALFTAADVASPAKSITITDAITSSPNGASYYGTIASYISATHITVSAPCPVFSSAVSQVVTRGHVDTTALNAASVFLSSGDVSVSGQPVLDGGGKAYGLNNTFHVKGNISLNNVSGIALTPVNIGVSSALVSFEGSFQTAYNDVWDANYLPINACTGTTNGRILLNSQRCKNWLGSYPNPINFTGVATVNAATFNGTVGSCTGSVSRRCTLTVNSGLSGTIQPGQGLSDPSSATLDGTYVIGYGAVANTYIVFNRTADPTASARSMTTLALDITVNNCVAANFDQQVASVNGSMGLVSHGNTGIDDRTYIVGCPGATTALLNKAPNKKISSGSANFYIDSNGVYLPGTTSVGIQFDQLSTNSDNFLNIPGNQYGASIYSDAAGGNGFTNASTFQGAAGIVIGPDGAGNRFFLSQHISNYGSTCCELNGPTVVMMDGSANTTLGNFQSFGQIQMFNAALGNTTPKLQLVDPNFGQNTAATLYAPGNLIWLYTEVASTLVDDITLSPFGVNQVGNGGTNAQLQPNMLALTVGGSGTWSEFTQTQIQSIMGAEEVMLPANAGSTMAFAGNMNIIGNLGIVGGNLAMNAGNVVGAGATTSQHYGGAGAAPTILQGAGSGNSGTTTGLDASASDAAFTITFTSGASPTAGTIATVTFNTAYANAPHCSFAPENAVSGALSGTTGVWITASTTVLVLHSGASALTNATAYGWMFTCTQ